ncbi:MAG: methylmalonyl Co-A mutase-associated GTPase MeaB [Phycisphaerales bacterium]|nr:methylmalonyl Co-A mutase-associated GTPase MeaB [Phycisphaerales bacterium]
MMRELAQEVLNGNRRALARLLTAVENEREGVEQALAALYPHTGRAWLIGVTGAPGTGKSTLVNALAKAYREQEKTVGIVAVDPTSPFTGGAILGDRIRMRDLAGDAGVFIRSMATRGSLGGLARATRDVARVLDAAGFDIVFVETVGAGQNEVAIVRMAHTTIVVEAPGLGDEVQAIKAGILEIADVLVVNKADRPGASNTVRALRTMLELGHPSARRLVNHHGQRMEMGDPNGGATPEVGARHALPLQTASESLWIPPIVETVAPEAKGVDELMTAIEAHRHHLEQGHALAQMERQHIEIELEDRLREHLLRRLLERVSASAVEAVIERVQARSLDPQSAVNELIGQAERTA